MIFYELFGYIIFAKEVKGMENPTALSLADKIELLRDELNNAFKAKKYKDFFINEDIIKLSSELDKLIVEFYRQKKQSGSI